MFWSIGPPFWLLLGMSGRKPSGRTALKCYLAAVLTLIPFRVFGQAPRLDAVDAGLATPTGHEVSVGAGSYNYVEPGNLRISIHGAKFGGEYAGTFSLDERRQWFATANARATMGSATYDGWCAPFVITPDTASPNRYAPGCRVGLLVAGWNQIGAPAASLAHKRPRLLFGSRKGPSEDTQI